MVETRQIRKTKVESEVSKNPTKGQLPTALPPLTKRQAKCLKFIVTYYTKNRIYPTQKEIIKAMGFRSTTAEMYLQPLRQKGYLQRKLRGHSRNVRTTPKAREAIEHDNIEIIKRRKPAS